MGLVLLLSSSSFFFFSRGKGLYWLGTVVVEHFIGTELRMMRGDKLVQELLRDLYGIILDLVDRELEKICIVSYYWYFVLIVNSTREVFWLKFL